MAGMVFNLKRASLQLSLFTFSLLLLAFASLHASAETIYSRNAASVIVVRTVPIINIQVDHAVQIQDGGLVIINDTIMLSTETGANTESIQNFSIGFPFKYSFNLDYCFAYDASNPDARFEVMSDVGLGKIGFYGINVMFPKTMSISYEKSYKFTVVFVFSNLVSSITDTLFNLEFPMYPSLAQRASICNVTVVLPLNANHTDSSFREKALDFNITTIDSRQVLNHTVSPLKDFAYEPAWLTFDAPTTFLTINANEIKREITLDEWGRIHLSDFYHITNKAENQISKIKLQLPQGAYGVYAQDVSGNIPVVSEEKNATTHTNATISLRTALKRDEAGKLTVTYLLPWKNYVSQYDWRDYNLTFTLFEGFNWTIRKLTVTITLPEGAEFLSSLIKPHSIQKGVFQETVTFIFYNATPFHNLNIAFTYTHLIFWASFRPTLWIGTLVVILCVVASFWRAPKPPIPIIPVSPEALRGFVDAYEEKTRILSELESMEEQLRKGKIPRRRYKVRKRTLEGRLSVLSRDLTDLREKIRTAGPRYADIMRQIEVAETELEGTEADIRRVEVRYRRGELSKDAYRKLLDGYHRRMERAKVTIDGVLLRLREEIR